MKYLLFVADFDENASELLEFDSTEGIREYLSEDDDALDTLLQERELELEWWTYHLIIVDGKLL